MIPVHHIFHFSERGRMARNKALHDAWMKLVWKIRDSDTYEILVLHNKYVFIKHETIFVDDRDVEIDTNVLPICMELWLAGIDTYFSCQGGPDQRDLRTGRIISHKAYVSVDVENAERVCEILNELGLRPKTDDFTKSYDNRKDPTKIAVRFDPPPPASFPFKYKRK